MLLKLEVVGAQASRLGEHRSRIFATEGGTIGRVVGNDWVLPDQFVSSRHAAIQYADGRFYVIDTNSSNGVFLNDPNFRLERGRPYPLKTGDRLLIDPFEIHVSVIESAPAQGVTPPVSAPDARSVARAASSSSAPPRSPGADPESFAVEEEVPFIGTLPTPDPPGPRRGEVIVPSSSDRPKEAVDPLVALGLPHSNKGRSAPRVADLASSSPLRSNFELPRITPQPPPQEEIAPLPPIEPVAAAIPADYNPLAQTGFESVAPRPPAPAARSDYRRPADQSPPPAREAPAAGSGPRPPPAQRAAPPPARAPSPAPQPSAPASAGHEAGRRQLDFAALLSAAGLENVPVTPELSASFGSILKAVVDGLRDVLRAREDLKDQFRLRITSVAPRENNPIKFSANTEDALHNLLVRHNPAYLEPVAAFEGAFDDLRIHQMAMLAGLRAGYQAMLAAFDPGTLEQKFERYARRGALLGGAAKQRYWDLYREVFLEMEGDTEATFRTLFGTAFAKAYEEHARLLKQRSRGQ